MYKITVSTAPDLETVERLDLDVIALHISVHCVPSTPKEQTEYNDIIFNLSKTFNKSIVTDLNIFIPQIIKIRDFEQMKAAVLALKDHSENKTPLIELIYRKSDYLVIKNYFLIFDKMEELK